LGGDKIFLPDKLIPQFIMLKKIFLCSFFIAVSPSVLSQVSERKNLKGKVMASASNLDGIYVLNLSSEKETVTKEGGYFSIQAKEGDSLMFSSIQFKGKIVEVSQADFEKELFFVKLETMVNQLDEVTVVQYKNINAYDLGIIPKPAKVYTPAERKLRTATGVDPKVGLNNSFTLDPLLNLMSGRTSMLKKELEVEKREKWISQLEDLFEEEYYTKKLKIPAENVKGFLYYAVENERLVKNLNSKNKAMATFLLGEIAKTYIQTITNEK
jgi:hypothetical protein